jgi:hypothetical protein
MMRSKTLGEPQSEDNTQAQLMRAVLDSSSTFMHVLQGPDFIVEYANAAYFRLVGQRDLIGRAPSKPCRKPPKADSRSGLRT